MKVYVIEDEKYGTQAVFADRETAEAENNTGKYMVSGYGTAVIEFEVETEEYFLASFAHNTNGFTEYANVPTDNVEEFIEDLQDMKGTYVLINVYPISKEFYDTWKDSLKGC